LYELIKKHSQNETQIDPLKIKKWAIEILEGLKFLHDKGIIHFDIKPDNIFLEELDRVKVGDLGLARDIEQITAASVGSPCSTKGNDHYISPELITKIKINEKTDIWY
jgi:serine/threonine protein kinase